MNALEQLRAHFGWTDSPEPEFLRLRAVAGSFPPLPATSTNAALLAALWAKPVNEITWDEIHAAKIALVGAMSLESLQTQYGTLAGEYETVTGGKPFTQGSFATPPKTIESWRAGVLSLMEDLAKFRRAKLMFERIRSIVGMSFGVLLVALVIVGFIYTQGASDNRESLNRPLWQPLLFVGLIGAGFSVLSRLYALTWTPKVTAQIEDAQALKKGLVINCILSLAEGVIAAGVIYLLFSSGMLKGDLFPAFAPEPATHSKDIFFRFLDYEPDGPANVAKLLAWAFIAGFAERLVPDKLNQLAGEAKAAKRAKANSDTGGESGK